MKHYEVISRRLAGFQVGNVVSEEVLTAAGVPIERRVTTGHIRPVDYNEEPKSRKRPGARKDGTDHERE